MQGSSVSPQALDQTKVVGSVSKHMVVRAKESQAGSSFLNQPALHPSVHFRPPVGITSEASQSRARFDGFSGLRQDEPQGGIDITDWDYKRCLSILA